MYVHADKPPALGPTAGQLAALKEFYDIPAASSASVSPPPRHRHRRPVVLHRALFEIRTGAHVPTSTSAKLAFANVYLTFNAQNFEF